MLSDKTASNFPQKDVYSLGTITPVQSWSEYQHPDQKFNKPESWKILTTIKFNIVLLQIHKRCWFVVMIIACRSVWRRTLRVGALITLTVSNDSVTLEVETIYSTLTLAFSVLYCVPIHMEFSLFWPASMSVLRFPHEKLFKKVKTTRSLCCRLTTRLTGRK